MSQIKADCPFVKRILLTSLVLLFLALSLLIFQVPVLHAAPKTTITVGSLLDSGGLCTLRNAILAANTNTPQGACTAGSSGADTIGFSVSGIITLTTSSLPAITDTLTIDGGNSITVSGDSNYQIITIDPGVAVSLTNISIQKGRTSGDGGAILNNGILKIDHASFISNTSTSNRGGAIQNNGVLTVTSSTFSLNRSFSHGGAIDNEVSSLYVVGSTFIDNATTSSGAGGAIDSDASTLTIINSTFTNNATAIESGAKDGGAIWTGSVTNIINSTFSSNHANLAFSLGNGGAIFISAADVHIVNSSFTANTAQNGGAIYVVGGVLITNTTVSGNMANSDGGGVANAGGTTTLNNVTVSNNTADNNNDGTGDGGGIKITSGTVNVENSIIAANFDTPGNSGLGTKHLDCSGTLTSLDYNLIKNTTGCTFAGTTTNNKTGQDPKLGGPAYYGGSTTLIQILLPGSPAINAGNNSTCASTDQRGVMRALSGGDPCDMGAYEGVGYGLYLPLISK